MLKELHINNVILIEKTIISFSQGFHAFTGETGAGKSAILQALALLLGTRADSNIIRKGADKAIVEAVFSTSPTCCQELEDAGIDHDPQEDLIIRREILTNGKSRAFINHQLAQLSLLRSIGKHLVDIISQHAHHQFFDIHQHRLFLDRFASLENLKQELLKAWKKEQTVQKQLQTILEEKKDADIKQQILEARIKEFETLNLKEQEEEELFQEYERLTHAEELKSHFYSIYAEFTESKHAVIPLLKKHKKQISTLQEYDTSLAEPLTALERILIDAEELSFSLRSYRDNIIYNPSRLKEVEDRLKLITQFKQKYGQTLPEIQQVMEQAKKELLFLNDLDDEQQKCEQALKQARIDYDQLAESLSHKRQHFAKKLELALNQSLEKLNLKKARFIVDFKKQERTQEGIDIIEFFLAPNIGEKPASLKSAASGGELSRVLLALKCLSIEVSTIIFDEIDANLGGETAVLVGQLLKEISSKAQVICITHLPQVAKQAHYHFSISKKEHNNRTLAAVTPLNKNKREQELARMLGGNTFSHFTKDFAVKALEDH